jgi:N-formylglutamate deformylase
MRPDASRDPLPKAWVAQQELPQPVAQTVERERDGAHLSEPGFFGEAAAGAYTATRGVAVVDARAIQRRLTRSFKALRMTIPDALPPYRLVRGTQPLLVSIPHAGTHIPEVLRGDYTDAALELADTDWHLDRLYAFAHEMGASVLSAVHSRCVIDLNRPPDNQSLYPGLVTTGLCPGETFRGEPLYRLGREPDAAEVECRLGLYWQPYHDALAEEIERLKALHGRVLLWEAHSIASRLPRLFDGTLPDLNLGTADGASCAPGLLAPVVAVAQASGYTSVINGRFKGGYITRHHGHPTERVHAIQLELCQCLYMDEQAPFDYLPAQADRLQPVLKEMTEAALGALSV